MRKLIYHLLLIVLLGCNQFGKSDEKAQPLIEKIKLTVLEEKNIDQVYELEVNNEH